MGMRIGNEVGRGLVKKIKNDQPIFPLLDSTRAGSEIRRRREGVKAIPLDGWQFLLAW
jgi:hypothetical protein